MSEPMTVSEAKQARKQLERDIAGLLENFTKETGIAIERLDVSSSFCSLSGKIIAPVYYVKIQARL